MPVLVVQLGHCNRTTGATGTAGEQDFARAVGAACQLLFHGKGGWEVRQILADPPSAASYRGDAFAAIHCDGNANTAVRGGSVGYATNEGNLLAQRWKDSYAARGWDGGYHPDNYTTNLAQYYGVKTAVGVGNRRAAILECGTLTSPADRARMTEPGGVDRVALALGDALGIPNLAAPAAKSEEDWMSALSEKEQRALFNRVMGFMRQRWYLRSADGSLREVAEGTPGAIPATALDTLDGNYLVGLLGDDEAKVIGAIRGLSVGAVDVDGLALSLAPLLPQGTTADDLVAAFGKALA